MASPSWNDERRDGTETTRQKVYDDYGGELPFYLAWVLGNVARRVRDWFRRRARADPALGRDVASVDDPAAGEDVRTALEATNYLTPAGPAPPAGPAAEESLTSLALGAPRRAAPGPSAAPPPDPAGMSDEELMRALQDRPDAGGAADRAVVLKELYRRYAGKLALLARHRSPRPELAEDCVQQLWTGLLDGRPKVLAAYDPGRGPVGRYLAVVLVRLVEREVRSRRRRGISFTDLPNRPSGLAVADRAGDPSDQAAAREFFDCVYHSLWASRPDRSPRQELLETALQRLSRREQLALCAWYDAGGDGDQALLQFRRAKKKGPSPAYRDYEDALSLCRQKLRDALQPHPAAGPGHRPTGLPPSPAVPADARSRLRQRLRPGLFRLLKEIEVQLPPREEVHEAGLLLQHLAGDEALNRFHGLDDWLRQVRARAADPRPPALDRLLVWLAAGLFVRDGAGYRYRLSFCLYLRARLRDYGRRRAWQPSGPRHGSLDAACAALGRERLGDLVRQAVEAEGRGSAAGVAVGRVLELLQADGLTVLSRDARDRGGRPGAGAAPGGAVTGTANASAGFRP